jgi:hypothetical protein
MRAIAALVPLAALACKTAVRPTARAEPPSFSDAGPTDAGPPPIEPAPPPPQPFTVIANISDLAVVALDAPAFAQLAHDQRLDALRASQTAAAMDAAAMDYGHTLGIVRMLRAILSRPAVAPPMLLPRIRDFARAVYLNRGVHDVETRRKLVPPFSMAELRIAALAAQAAGADFALPGAKLEFALRALEGPLFDPRVDPQRPRSEPRSSEPLPGVTAPLELVPFSGRLFIGIADEERSRPLAALAQFSASQNRPVPSAEALQLTGGAGPLPAFGFPLPGRVALFTAAADALDKVRTAGALSALADPALASDLLRCLPRHRLAQLALREVIGRQSEGLDPTLDEARADLVSHVLAADPRLRELGLLSARCQELWPQFVATLWFLSQAHLPSGDRIEDERQRATQLELWWFTGKGALSERHEAGRRFLSAHPARFQKAAAELLALLQDIAASRDLVRLRDLLESHASKLDAQWRSDVIARLRAAGVPRRVALLPPRLEPVLIEGKEIDAQARPVEDFDAEILREWAAF